MNIIIKNSVISACMMCCTIGAASCSGDGSEETPKFINISATISQGMTRATTTGNSMAFETGDRLNIYVWVDDMYKVNQENMVVNGTVNTLDATGKWTSSPQMLWADMRSHHYFLGIYPTRTVSDFKADPHRITGNYEDDDLLAGMDLSGMTPTSNTIGLEFDHLMAKVHLNLNFRNEWENTIESVAVDCQAVDACTVDYLALSSTPVGNQTSIKLSQTTTVQGFDQSWQTIMVPQENFREITISVNGKHYTYTHPEDIPLRRGCVTRINLIIGLNVIELGTIKIDGWESEYSLDGSADIQIK